MYRVENLICCGKCENKWDNFNNLNESELTMICENRYQTVFKKGEIIFKQGSPISDAVFLLSGYAKTHIEGFDGKSVIIGIAKQSYLIAGPGVYVDNRHNYTLTALSDVRACFIKMDIIKDLVRTNSKFAEGFLIDISRKSVGTLKKLISQTQKKMPGRLAETLLYLANDIHKSDDFTMLLSRQELGELSGMAKESVVRLLKEFHDANLIEEKEHHFKIIDKEMLVSISNKG